jgi:hypothetical protein
MSKETKPKAEPQSTPSERQSEQELSPRARAFLDLYSLYLSIPKPSHYNEFGYNAWKRK